VYASATVLKLTLASVYNPPHTIRKDIKVRQTHLYFQYRREKIPTRPSGKLAAETELRGSWFAVRVF